MKWFDDEVNKYDRKHLGIQERPRSNSFATHTVHNVNIDTVLDEKKVSPIKLGRQKEQSLAQHSESVNCKVTKGNRFLNHTRKTPATRSDDFFMGKLNVKNFDVLNNNLAVLP
jgi:hypothetical protein